MHPHVPRPPRPPHGTVTHIASEAYDDAHEDEDEETSRDGPALTARFGDIGGFVAADGALYISDFVGNQIRTLHDGVVSTLAGAGEGGFRDGDSVSRSFTIAWVSLSAVKGVSWWRILRTNEFDVSRWTAPRQHSLAICFMRMGPPQQL